jgi:hypothetical protein
MTVSTTVSRWQYDTNGTTGPWTVGALFLADEDLRVTHTDADGVDTLLTLSVDYTVSGAGVQAGGTVTTTDAYASGGTITIVNDPEALQETDYSETDAFPAATHERALDLLTLIAQRLRLMMRRAIRVSDSEDELDEAPSAQDRALKTLTCNALGVPVWTTPAEGTSSALAADLIDDSATTNGAGMVGWSPSIAYGADTVGKKLRQVIHVEDHGAVGDGTTDDSTAIDSAIALGLLRKLEVHFDGSKTYKRSTVWTITSGSRVRTNGATFSIDVTTTGNTSFVDIESDCRIDEIKVSIPTGVRRDRCIRATGDDVQIGKITLSSVDVQTTSEADDSGVIIRNGSRMWIGMIDVTNYDRGVIVTGTTDSAIGRVNVTGYVRGLYAWDNVNLKVMGGHIKTRSVNGAESAGHNGLLLACTAPASQRWCRFENLVIENAGEHAIRIGGDDDATPTGYHEHIWITNFAVYDCNGCGVKILGTNAVTPTARNKSIWLTGVIEDAGRGVGSGENRVGVLIQHADHVYLSVRVMKRDQTYSCTYPVYIDSAASVTLADCWLMDGSLSGVAMTCANGNLADINIIGGRVKSNGTAGLALTVQAAKTATSVNVNGLAADSNGTLGFTINVSGTATDCLVGMKTYNNTTGAGACNSTAIMLDIVGDPGGTPKSGISAATGSRWLDPTAGDFTYKSGVWGPLSGSATWNPGNLADGAGETTTVTVTGAALGMSARASFSLDLQGMQMTPYVSAANTVSVRLQNETGGAIDLGSGTLSVSVTPI